MPKTLKLRPPEPSEAAIQAALMRRLAAAGFVVIRINSAAWRTEKGFYRAYSIHGLKTERGQDASCGFPDVLALKGRPDGTVAAHLIEVKKAGGALSEGQVKFHEFAAARGVIVHVVEGWAAMGKAVAELTGA